MIQLGSILQIPLCIICVREMDKPESPSYSALNDQYIAHEQITQADLPPGIKMIISNMPFASPTWTQTTIKKIQVVTLCKIFQTLYLCNMRVITC